MMLVQAPAQSHSRQTIKFNPTFVKNDTVVTVQFFTSPVLLSVPKDTIFPWSDSLPENPVGQESGFCYQHKNFRFWSLSIVNASLP